jgi:hypothetical protein
LLRFIETVVEKEAGNERVEANWLVVFSIHYMWNKNVGVDSRKDHRDQEQEAEENEIGRHTLIIPFLGWSYGWI